jgi:hypothetical protein
MLTPRNPSLGPEDPGFAKWCLEVLAAAIAVWGAIVEGLDWARSVVVPELVVGDNRILLNQMGYTDYQKGRPILDFLRAGLPAPPQPAPAPQPEPVYLLFTPFQDPTDGVWYEYHPWMGPGIAPLKCRVAAPVAAVKPPPTVEITTAMGIASERQAFSAYLQGRLVAQIQPPAVRDEMISDLIWLSNQPK